MEEKIKTIESNKDMPMMEMMHNEEMEEMMGMGELKEKISALEEKVKALEISINKLSNMHRNLCSDLMNEFKNDIALSMSCRK